MPLKHRVKKSVFLFSALPTLGQETSTEINAGEEKTIKIDISK